MDIRNTGEEMYKLAEELFPICRSITGNGVRKTFNIIKKYLPNLKIHEVPSGTKCFDWEIPEEWNVNDAYIKDEKGQKIVDFKKNNLHLVSYSIPTDKKIRLEELNKHLHSLPNQPDSIPYQTSYYTRRWGFCISENQRINLRDEIYSVKIDSNLEKGSLTYADLLIKGESKEEILISTYICHPSMANNETSGPVLATFLSKWIENFKNKKYSYRIIFVPETIGAVAYLSNNLDVMKKNTIAGFILTCVGDDRVYSYMPSRTGNLLADKVALHVLNKKIKKYNAYTFLDRGSDERQYCAPGIDLPVCSIMRSKYGDYPEYHTSEDNLGLISSQGFQGSFDAHIDMIQILESNKKYKATYLGEPQLGKRNLRSDMGAGKGLSDNFKNISDFLAYADGELDIIDIANILNIYALDLIPIVTILQKHGLIKSVD